MKRADIKNMETQLLLEAVFQRYGHDFRQYSRDSIQRRIDNILLKENLKTETCRKGFSRCSMTAWWTKDFYALGAENPFCFQTLRTGLIPWMPKIKFFRKKDKPSQGKKADIWNMNRKY